ncbi:MAG: MoaD/ThiS family protein [Planctomycetota bacterium]|nr:MoaD/ThiS family protein [Planctomycetota bacterium]
MIVHVPTPLRSYTDEAARVEVEGDTLDDVLRALDKRYPGLRFRIVDEAQRLRTHIKLFVGHAATDDLNASVKDVEDVHIICALSGG